MFNELWKEGRTESEGEREVKAEEVLTFLFKLCLPQSLPRIPFWRASETQKLSAMKIRRDSENSLKLITTPTRMAKIPQTQATRSSELRSTTTFSKTHGYVIKHVEKEIITCFTNCYTG